MMKFIVFASLFVTSVGCEFNPDLGSSCFLGDPCAADPDEDGIPNWVDNCPLVKNPLQEISACLPTNDVITDGNDLVADTAESEVADNDIFSEDADTTSEDTELIPDTLVAEEVALDIEDTQPLEEIELTDTPDVPDELQEDSSDTQEEDITDTQEEDIPETWIDTEEPDTTLADTQPEDVTVLPDTEEVADDVPEVTKPPDTQEEDVFVPLCTDTDCPDDGNPCTNEFCNPTLGCQSNDNTDACSDGNPCTTTDVCANGQCVSDTNVCACEATADCASKEDNDLCNGTLICVDNNCIVDQTTVITCPEASESCYYTACTPSDGTCQQYQVPDEIDCDDDNECTIADICLSGVCTGKNLVCDDNNVCTTDTCDPITECQYQPAPLNCDDNNVCTGVETCDPIVGCVSSNPPTNCCQQDSNCTDTLICTIDTCEQGQCHNEKKVCDDDDICTINVCDPQDGLCNFYAVSCDDSNACTFDQCLSKSGIGCIHIDVSDGAPCDDSSVCTEVDQCFTGLCRGNQPRDCRDDIDCTTDTCDAILGCQNTNNTDLCEDGDACTTGDSCANGACLSGFEVVCNDNNDCTRDYCDSIYGCVYDATDSDGDTVPDACDDDADNDGFANNVDNCPLAANLTQIDTDEDDVGDACDNELNCVVAEYPAGFPTGYEKPNDSGVRGCMRICFTPKSHVAVCMQKLNKLYPPNCVEDVDQDKVMGYQGDCRPPQQDFGNDAIKCWLPNTPPPQCDPDCDPDKGACWIPDLPPEVLPPTP